MNRPDLCPACGARNDCTLADPRTADRACWCYDVSIDPAVLEALPVQLRNKAVCARAAPRSRHSCKQQNGRSRKMRGPLPADG